METIRVLYSRKEAAAALSLGVRTLDQLLESGTLPVLRVGRRVLIPREALEAFSRGIEAISQRLQRVQQSRDEEER